MEMSPVDIREIVLQVMAEERRQLAEGQDEIVLKTISTILTSFGIDDEERSDIRADLIHLRKWRKSVESVESFGMRAVVTVIVTGLIAALWLGFKAMVNK